MGGIFFHFGHLVYVETPPLAFGTPPLAFHVTPPLGRKNESEAKTDPGGCY